MLKNVHFRLGLIAAILVVSVLIVLPKTPIVIKNKYIDLDSNIGGYYINLFNGKLKKDLTQFKKGLDLEGGIRVVLKADMSDISDSDRDGAMESATGVIERRVNLLGVSEPLITPSKIGDEYRIVVEIPGVSDTETAISLIGQTAQLKFKKLKAELEFTEEKFKEYYVDPSVWEDTGVTGADLRGVDVVFEQQQSLNNSNSPQIQLKFTPEGREKFSQVAKENVNRPVALFLDEDSFPLSAPTISPDLAEGLKNDPVISGTFSLETANALSIQIRAGALPVPVEILEQKTVGATLGGESVNKSFTAGVVGLWLVFMFLVFMYKRLGILAGLALLIYSLTTLAIFKLIPVVLTLPGIAGFVLSIGMATDANILVFERIKEEISWGRPKNLAIKLGFDRAWNSIKDSNMSSLLTSAVLFYFGSGPVRGFALTLSIGILVSLFSSIFVVKTFIEVFRFGNQNFSTAEVERKWEPKRLLGLIKRGNSI